MPVAERSATAEWTGDLPKGKGRVTFATGALPELPVTWAARTEAPDGKTSPEELIAGAHAACFCMAFSNTLSQDGHPPEKLTVQATCAFDRVDGKMKITTMTLRVRGVVPGLDAAAFRATAKRAEQGCPVSNALRNNVRIELDADLAS